MRKQYDPWSILVIALTLVLFVVALFVKGVQHDLLLETGVFLVSVKLILMSYKSTILGREVVDRLDQIHVSLREMQRSPQLPAAGD
jgi:protein-S-isoprenylcysteine O-methyltransferase Ste14